MSDSVAVGSSRISTRASRVSIRAISTSCRWPMVSAPTGRVESARRPCRAARAPARARVRSSRPACARMAPSPTAEPDVVQDREIAARGSAPAQRTQCPAPAPAAAPIDGLGSPSTGDRAAVGPVRRPSGSSTSVLLPAPFSPQIARISPAAQRQRDILERGDAAEALAQRADTDNGAGGRGHLSVSAGPPAAPADRRASGTSAGHRCSEASSAACRRAPSSTW